MSKLDPAFDMVGGKDVSMKYLILIHHNKQALDAWEGMSQQARQEGLRLYAGFHDELAASGELVVSEALANPSQGMVVTAHNDGRVTTADGPFAEAKEHLAGFFLVDCVDRDRAVEIAARVPEAALGLVEVRPVQDLQGLIEDRP
jgi:hypothetical protein